MQMSLNINSTLNNKTDVLSDELGDYIFLAL